MDKHQFDQIEVLDKDHKNEFFDFNKEIQLEEKGQNWKFLDTSGSDNNKEIIDSNVLPEKREDKKIILSEENQLDDRFKQVNQKDAAETKRKIFQPGNTLTEPIVDTFKRDLIRIYEKIKFVLKLKKTDEDELKAILDWDLWGPFLLCILLSW
jgi:hypothetical protein